MNIEFLVNFKRKTAVYLTPNNNGLYCLNVNGCEIHLSAEALALLNFKPFRGVLVESTSALCYSPDFKTEVYPECG